MTMIGCLEWRVLFERSLGNLDHFFDLRPVRYCVDRCGYDEGDCFQAEVYVRFRIGRPCFRVLLSRTSADVVSSLVIASVGIFASFESAYFSVTALCLFVGTFGFIHTTLCNLFLVLIRQVHSIYFITSLAKSRKTTLLQDLLGHQTSLLNRRMVLAI